MADVKWIKITTDIFDDEKILLIESIPEADSLLVIWFKLLTFAGKSNNSGVFVLGEKIPYTDEMLATIFRRPLNTVRLALSTFEKFGMIEYIDNIITLPNWEKHQNIDGMDKIREQNRNRKRLQRERQKQALLEEECHVTVTGSHAIEEEGRREEDKEIHSFILSENCFVKSENLGEIVDNSVDKSVDNSKRAYLSGELGKGVVLLSDEQLDDLLSKLTVDEFDKYVGIVANLELSGKHYRKKTHHQAILEMAMKDRRIK